MKILILTAGSRGDVQPFVALAMRLQADGNSVLLNAPARFQSMADENGVPFAPMDDEFLSFKDSVENPGFGLIKQVKPMLRRMMSDQWEAAQGFQPDAVVYHPKTLGAYHIAEKLDIPLFLSMPLPAYTPTREMANPIMPGNVPGFLNKLTYGMTRMVTMPFADVINDFRLNELGLSKRYPKLGNDKVQMNGQPIPAVYSYSGHVVPEPSDWPEHATASGYWFLDAATDWQPPADLAAFLDAGPAPVYIGFGSMSAKDAAAKTRVVLDGVQQSGQRAVIATGWGGLEKVDNAPESVYFLEQAPHDWLFPRVAAVVHHGGSGTTAAGLRAGKPTMIFYWLGDQPFWGKRVHEAGAGPAPITQKQMTAENLANAIRTMVSDDSMRRQAEEIGAMLRAEDGPGNAAAFIYRWMGVSPEGTPEKAKVN
jgi:sterol 3beta-glucosyltransferase